MGLNETVIYTLVGRDQLSKTFEGASKSAKLLAAGVIAVGAGLVKIGSDFDKAYDTIRVGTGATGKSLEALKGDFKAVVKDVPTDFSSASKAVADLNTRTGLTGKPLQEMSKQFLNLSRITGEDVSTSVASMTRVFGDWSIKTGDQTDAMDSLFRASQSTGIGVNDLARQVVQFGAPLRQLGFGFEESAALMGKWEKEGVNAGVVLAGMKIGLGQFAKAGKEPAEALKLIIERIKGAGTAGEANGLAIKAFGQRAGPDMAAAVREGRFGIEDLLKVVKGGKETINDAARDTEDFGEKWIRIKNQVFVALEPAAMALFDGIGAGMDDVTETVGNMKAAWDDMPGWVKVGLGSLAGITATAPVVVGAFNGIKAQIEKMKTAYAQMGTASKIAHGAMGAVGAILGVAAIALAAFGTKSAEAKERQEGLAAAGKRVAEVIREQNGVINETVRMSAAKEAEDAGLLTGLKKLGIEYGTVTDAILGQGDAYDQIRGKIQAEIDILERRRNVKGGGTKAIRDEQAALEELLASLDTVVGGKQRDAAASKRVEEAMEGSTDATKDNADAHRDLSEELQTTIDKMREAAGKTLSARDAQRRFEESVDDARQAVKENGKTLDISTEKGRKNQDTLDNMAKAALDQADAMAKNGTSHKVTQNKMSDARGEFIRTARQMGLSKTAAEKLATKLGLIPGKYKADIHADTKPANTQLDKFVTKWNGKKITFNLGGAGTGATAVNRLLSSTENRRDGGPIFGPGGPRDDKIPAMLSNGEHVLTASEVVRMGGHHAVEQFRGMVRAGKIPAFAAGGAVTLKAGADTSSATDAFSGAAKALQKAMSGGGSALAWARSQTGKPYIWGGVGPGGYDCSGFMSAIVNIIRGRSPFSRLGSTGTFPWSGFAPGFGRFTIGSFRGNPGHMAGTLGGVNVESRGGDGVVVGPGARGANSAMFTTRYHLRGFAQGGAVRSMRGDPPFDLIDPRGLYAMRANRYNRPGGYDNGGKLMPGYTLAYNGTGKPENVVSSTEPIRLHPDDIRAIAEAGKRFNVTVNNAKDKPTRRVIHDTLDRLTVMHGG